MIAPTPVQNVHEGREAFARDLKKVLGADSLAERNWAQPDELTLHVPLFATTPKDQVDWYLLRLYFDHYPKFPPSAQFINPITQTYEYPRDVMWVPRCENATVIHFHSRYNGGGQLICSSTTLEFYKVNHDVTPENIWNPDRMNFLSTLAAIRVGLTAKFYQGRSIQ